MQHHLATLRRRRAEGDHGFTLIELLVVVVIIGILIAIAIPVYLNYQKGAKDKSAASDLRNAIGVLEQCNSDNSAYPSSLPAATPTTNPTGYVFTTTTGCSGQTINISSGTTMAYTTLSTPSIGYRLTDSNSGGKPTYYCYNSTVGGAISSSTTAAPSC